MDRPQLFLFYFLFYFLLGSLLKTRFEILRSLTVPAIIVFMSIWSMFHLRIAVFTVLYISIMFINSTSVITYLFYTSFTCVILLV